MIALLKGKKDKVSMRFKLRTKMDSPNLDFSSIKNGLKGNLRSLTICTFQGVLAENRKAPRKLIACDVVS